MHDLIPNAPLHLASGSRARRDLLRGAGLVFTAGPADVDEDAIKATCQKKDCDAAGTALALAREKASVASIPARDGYVLGCDQVLDLGGRLLSKATTRTDAFETLNALQGRPHRLQSAASIFGDGKEVWHTVSVATLTMHPFTPDALHTYLDATWPSVSDAVGCYHLEGRGVRLFSGIEGDFFTVLGLPLLEILAFLRREGGLGP
ncbi:MAG: nucleoside triphosphate pyrophosphatase [Pseudomonadota bacterium]